MSIPQPGDRYQHFAGTVYEVVGIAQPPDNPDRRFPEYVATHTETGQLVLIWHQGDRYWAKTTDGELIEEPIVLYWELDSSKLWARPLENFLEVLSSGASVDKASRNENRASNYHRFAKIGGGNE